MSKMTNAREKGTFLELKVIVFSIRIMKYLWKHSERLYETYQHVVDNQYSQWLLRF